MNQPSAVAPSAFNVTCPGCGQRLRFSVVAEMPPRLRIQCSSCKTTFGVRRPGVEPGQLSAASLGEAAPTYLAFPVTNPPAGDTLPRMSPGSTPVDGPRPRAVDEPAFPPEATIAGRYRGVRFIARGGMGEV